MELTRRDAVLALGTLGAGGAAVATAYRAGDGLADGDGDPAGACDEAVRETLVAAATVLYPSEVTDIEPFVETFLAGRLTGGSHAAGLRATVETLNDRASEWYGSEFASLSAADRESLLAETGADTAEPRREGTTAERVRYYVVNELLLALYASPTGGELVGLENPQGYAGGIESYRRGPEA